MMLYTTLQDTSQFCITQTNQFPSVWFYIALIEFGILLIFIRRLFKQNKPDSSKKQQIKNTIKGNIDFQNIINSSFHATELYNELKIKCHPDCFIGNKEKMEIANQLFQEITKNKTNYNRLYELKQQSQNQLNIKFKN